MLIYFVTIQVTLGPAAALQGGTCTTHLDASVDVDDKVDHNVCVYVCGYGRVWQRWSEAAQAGLQVSH